MPRTVKPRSSSAAASDAPRPREMPVIIAACEPSSIPNRGSAMHAQRQRDKRDDDDRNHEQGDLDPALGVLTLNRAGKAIHHGLEALHAITVGKQPYRRENMLESLPRVVRAHVEIAIRVALDLCRAHLAELRFHRLAR